MKKIFTLLFHFLLINICFGQPTIDWQKTIGGGDWDDLSSFQKTPDNGFVLCGYSWSDASADKTENSIGSSDYWIVKLDSSKNIQWQNTIGGDASEYLYAMDQTSDKGFILGGYSTSGISGDKTEDHIGTDGYADCWIVKLDSSGNIQWQNNIGGNEDDAIFSIAQTSDDGYILGAVSTSGISGDKTEDNIGNYDYWIIKLDENGNIVWQNTIGGSETDLVRSVQQTNDDGYIIAGYSRSPASGDKNEDNWDNTLNTGDYWIVKLDESGNVQWQNTIGGTGDDQPSAIIQTSDSGYLVGGISKSNADGDKTENSNGGNDYWVVKLDAEGNFQWQNDIGGNGDDVLSSLKQTIDGGFILGGYSDSGISGDKTENSFGHHDYWIVKLNTNGNVDWQSTIGGNQEDYCNYIEEISQGEFLVGGESKSGISGAKTEASRGSYDYWVLKMSEEVATFVNSIPEKKSSFHIYPNPVNDILNVVSEEENICSVFITDLSGKTVLKVDGFSPQKQKVISLDKFNSGIFLLQVKTPNGIYYEKVVKN